MKQLALINPENVSEKEVKEYPVRESVRAIVVDEEGKIALLHVVKENYFKWPGGGIEGAEDKMTALNRECDEEIACDIEVFGEIGSIVEYRTIFNLKQISYCYLAKVKKKKGVPTFTDFEKEKGFKNVWLNYEEAMNSLINSQATSVEGRSYIVPRDTILLKEAKNYLAKL
ncbi:MAG: NUDIX domain-containing protein [Patescibacteria group bacterium]